MCYVARYNSLYLKMKPDSAPTHPFFVSFLVSSIIHCLWLVIFGVVLTSVRVGDFISVQLVERSVSSDTLKLYTERLDARQAMPFVLPFEDIRHRGKDDFTLGNVNSFRLWQDMPIPQSERHVSPAALSVSRVSAPDTADIFLLEDVTPEKPVFDPSAGMEINFMHYPVRHVRSGQKLIGEFIGEETVVVVLYVDGHGNVISSFLKNSSGNSAVDDTTLKLCRALSFDPVGLSPDPYVVQAMKVTFRMDAAACLKFANSAAAGGTGV